MEEVDFHELVESLGSADDSIRKRAAFRLQALIGDLSFTDAFESAGGLSKLRMLALSATGNTLAYSLAAFSRLLELDQGWKYVDQQLIARLVELVVAHPLVNILRGAMSILALVVAYPNARTFGTDAFGFRALKPAIDAFPNFLEMLVGRLSSADHALCANALQLINSLMRDSITNGADDEWPKFIKRLQDLGVIKAVYSLMQGSGLQDLAQPLLEFQFLTKLLLRKWRKVRVDLEKKEHIRALKVIQIAGAPHQRNKSDGNGKMEGKERDNEQWRKLGFESESPASEFKAVGFLGVMDLTDYARKSEDGFHKLMLEQAAKPLAQRCPVAKASLAVTSILYDHFEIDSSDSEDHQRYVALESRSNFDKVFRPLLLQWSRIHTSGLQAFLRIWMATGAETKDFYKIEELVRILIEHVVGLAPRSEDVLKVEQDLANYELPRLRELQMELLELTHEDAWGHHLRQIKDELHHEALQFIKEQRIRCLLAGSWFPNITSPSELPSSPRPPTTTPFRPSMSSHTIFTAHTTGTRAWRYVRLSHNRRHLHYADFDMKSEEPPVLDSLEAKIDLAIVSSVVSNISQSDGDNNTNALLSDESDDAAQSINRLSTASDSRKGSKRQHATEANTTITILGTPPQVRETTPGVQESKHARTNTASQSLSHKSRTPRHAQSSSTHSMSTPSKELPLLSLHLNSTATASEWLDGLLMLLNQAPITAETNRTIEFIAKYGLKIRLLNVRFEEALVVGLGGSGRRAGGGYAGREVVIPGREGLDDNYYYDVAGL